MFSSHVERIALFVEHLRDGYQSTTEPVGKVARLIREKFGPPAPVTPEPPPVAPLGDSLMIAVPDATRGDLIAALATMPDEAFGWFVLACPQSAMMKGGLAQIWPDGMGGFSSESRASVEAVRQAAATYLSAPAPPVVEQPR